MRQDKTKEKSNSTVSIPKIASWIYIIAALLFMVSMWRSGILPLKFEVVFAALTIAVGTIIILFIHHSGKGALSTFLTIIALLVSVILCMGSYFLIQTGSFVDKIVNVDETADFYVVAKVDSDKESMEDLKGETITVPAHKDLIYEKAENELKEKAEVNIEVSEKDSLEVCKDLLKGKTELVMLNSAYYDIAEEEIDDFNEEAVKIIAEINIQNEKPQENKKEVKKSEPFNLYITGIDTSGRISNVSRSDVNMVVTVNPETKQILLTSIPRDYYVELANVGAMDKLTHSGLMGPDVTVQTVENLLGVDINYYLKVNFSTVTSLVDILGGIDVESEYAFTSRKGHYDFVEGINHMNGDMALCFARERYAFASGDRQRVKNQQAVIKAIIDKATSSPSILLKYNEILNSLDENMQTNMDAAKIKELVAMQLNDMAKWDISSISLDGSGAMSTTYYYPNTQLYVMVPNQETVNAANAKINEIMNNKTEE